jgi:hypothetical protein
MIQAGKKKKKASPRLPSSPSYSSSFSPSLSLSLLLSFSIREGAWF